MHSFTQACRSQAGVLACWQVPWFACRVLADALTLMNERQQDGQQKVEFHVINPKAVTMGQLYGMVRAVIFG